jgi:hypothetical protein
MLFLSATTLQASFLVLVLVLSAPGASASQLRNDPLSLCVAYGNGTVFNVSSLPWSSFSFSDARGYTYWLSSPCAPKQEWTHACPGFADNSTVLCQKDHLTAGLFYDCGGVTLPPTWLLNGLGLQQFTILFGGGNNWRITNVTFVADATVNPPVASFDGESPYLQYNVVVRGKCVGQPWGCSSDGAAAQFALDAPLGEEPVAGYHAMHVNATGGSCNGDC